MLAVQRSILARVAKYGLRVICPRCAMETRHKPGAGRLRHAKCPACGHPRMRAVSWALAFPDRWEQVVKEARALAAPFNR